MTNVIMTGPLLTGNVEGILDGISDQVQLDVANVALERVHDLLNMYIRNPTPYYETQIVRQQLRTDQVIHDRGIVYGPWLEGVSRRNQTTRFKGYHAFRTARQETELRAPDIANDTIRRRLTELGG